MADRFFIGTGNRNTNTTANWSDTSGGSGGASVPGASDAAIFDANSGLTGVTITFDAAFSVASISYAGGAAKTNVLSLAADVTCSGAFAVAGNSATNRVLIASNTVGTQRTITAATVTLASVDLRDIKGAGAGSWDLSAITGGSGDCGGNTGITFTTADEWFYHAAEAGDNKTSTVGKWFTATNGGGSVATYPPLPQDTMKFDSNSFDSAGITVTQDMPRIGSVDFTGATNSPTWTTSTAAEVYGGITLISGMTLTSSSTQTYSFRGRGAYPLTSAGKTWSKALEVDVITGSITLQDAFATSNLLSIVTGTFVFSNHGITVGRFSAGACTVTVGTSLITVTGAGGSYVFTTSNSTSIDLSSATVKLTNTGSDDKIILAGSLGRIYGVFWHSPGAGTGNLVLTRSNTFADFKDDGTAAHAIKFTAGTTTKIGTLTLENGSAGAKKTITSITGATHTLESTGSDIEVEFCDISYSVATGMGTWTADKSTDSGNNIGWIFKGGGSGGGMGQGTGLTARACGAFVNSSPYAGGL